MSPRRLPRALFAFALALASAAHADAPQDFILHCQGCHGADGQGVPHKVPAIAESIPRLVAIEAGREFLMRVPGAASSRLPDERLAGVLNWLVERYAGPAALKRPYTAEDVGAARRRPLAAVHRTRLEIAAQLAAAGLASPADY